MICLTTPPTPINDAHPGGLLFSGWQALKYLKPSLSIEKQIARLQQRGMDISVHVEVAHYLARSIQEGQGNLIERLKRLASFGLVEFEEGERTRGQTALVPKVSFERIVPPTINLNDLSKAA